MTQEVFVKTYYALDRFQGQASFSSWLYRITVNRCLDELKRRRRSRTLSLDETHNSLRAHDRASDEPARTDEDDQPSAAKMQHARLHEALRQALDGLPEHQRTVIILKELEQLSYQEVAEVVEISVGTVKSRLARARAELRVKLQPFFTTRLNVREGDPS